MSINEGIESYSDSVSKSCREDNINFNLWRVPGGYNIVQQIDNLIYRANVMPDVHGILVFYPLLSNKPEILGWDANDVDLFDSKGNRKWTLDQQKHNIKEGWESVLHYHQKCIPGSHNNVSETGQV